MEQQKRLEWGRGTGSVRWVVYYPPPEKTTCRGIFIKDVPPEWCTSKQTEPKCCDCLFCFTGNTISSRILSLKLISDVKPQVVITLVLHRIAYSSQWHRHEYVNNWPSVLSGWSCIGSLLGFCNSGLSSTLFSVVWLFIQHVMLFQMLPRNANAVDTDLCIRVIAHC